MIKKIEKYMNEQNIRYIIESKKTDTTMYLIIKVDEGNYENVVCFMENDKSQHKTYNVLHNGHVYPSMFLFSDGEIAESKRGINFFGRESDIIDFDQIGKTNGKSFIIEILSRKYI